MMPWRISSNRPDIDTDHTDSTNLSSKGQPMKQPSRLLVSSLTSTGTDLWATKKLVPSFSYSNIHLI